MLALFPRVAFGDDAPVDAQARWLAGMAPLEATPPGAGWSAYSQEEALRWQMAGPRVTAMREWSTREILPLIPRDRAVFYPFAGPDALHAIALFAESPQLVLVGLEPVGSVPAAAAAPPRFFSRLGAALRDVHRLTFFRTHAMASDFERDGVLGALMATVARIGGTLTGVQTTQANTGARIDWVTNAGKTRRLDYVKADLANAGLKADTQLTGTLRALAPYVTFVKAASYLIGEARFSYVRQMILEDSAVVVQDDSGIPFHHFDGRWAMRFFGRYERPSSPFEDRLQADLAEAFARRAVTA